MGLRLFEIVKIYSILNALAGILELPLELKGKFTLNIPIQKCEQSSCMQQT